MGIGTGAPKLQPVDVQSNPTPGVGSASSAQVTSGSTEHPPRRKWTTAPSGSVDGGRPPLPLPSERSPQSSVPSVPPSPSRVTPHAPVPATLANSTVSGRSGGSSVLVVLVDGVGVVVVLAPVVVVGGSDVVLDVVVVSPRPRSASRSRAGSPRPVGRLAAALMPFAVPGTQKVGELDPGWATRCQRAGRQCVR